MSSYTPPPTLTHNGDLCRRCPEGQKCGIDSTGGVFCYSKRAAHEFGKWTVGQVFAVVLMLILIVAAVGLTVAQFFYPETRIAKVARFVFMWAYYTCCIFICIDPPAFAQNAGDIIDV